MCVEAHTHTRNMTIHTHWKHPCSKGGIDRVQKRKPVLQITKTAPSMSSVGVDTHTHICQRIHTCFVLS